MRPSLLDNPFAVLKVPAFATNEDIVDAYDDLSGGDIDDVKLAEARQALLTPRTRLASEVAFLTDTSEAEAARLLGQLGSRGERSSLIAASERLSPLSRANYVAALIEAFGLTDDLLIKLVSAQAEIALGDVFEVLRRVRTKAGIVSPNKESVTQALDALFEQHAKIALQAASDSATLAAVVTSATVAICATNDADRLERLDALQQAYWRTVSRETSALRHDLETIGERLLDAGQAADIDAYIATLKRWDLFGQPLQVLERARGREDREAQAVQASVRELCLKLSNEKKRSAVALKITQAAREVFAELERTAATLKEDVEILADNAAFEASRPLEEVLNRLRPSLNAFAREIEAKKTGPGSNWATLFGVLADTLPKAPGQDAPWMMLRSFGVDLFKTTQSESATLAFVTAVLERARLASAPRDIVKRLEDDLTDLDGVMTQRRLGEAVEAKKWDKALALAQRWEAAARTPEDRTQAATLITGIRRAQNRQTWAYVKWGSAAFVGLVMVVSALNENSRRPPSTYSPPSTQVAPPPTSRPSSGPQTFDQAPLPRAPSPGIDPGAEVKPARLPPGFGEQPRFSIGNIRYCLFESERIERLRSRASTSDDIFIHRFNAAVEDWNAHCSRYRYMQSDMDAVRAEVRARSDDLTRQAFARAETWRPATRAPAPTPAPAPPVVFPEPPALPPSAPPQTRPQTWPGAASSSPAVDLLDQDMARRVQVRLAELGYLNGPASGTWGPASRAAMRAFNMANGMGDRDIVTSAAAGVLFGEGAVRASLPAERLPPGYAEARYPPPLGAMLNPLNGTDAVEVHRLLRDLGFYKGRNETLWSGASRVALRDFKARNGLPADDVWDFPTESALKAQANDPRRNAERDFQARIVGRWTTDLRSCARRQPDLPVPIVISSDRAAVGGQGCDFTEKTGSGDQWTVRAFCRVDGGSWNANIRLSRSGDSLTWTSERGTTVYRRCET